MNRKRKKKRSHKRKEKKQSTRERHIILRKESERGEEVDVDNKRQSNKQTKKKTNEDEWSPWAFLSSCIFGPCKDPQKGHFPAILEHLEEYWQEEAEDEEEDKEEQKD